MHSKAKARGLFLLLIGLLPATIALGERAATPPPTCEEFVYLDNGQFKLEGQPYAMKGVNFTLIVGADLEKPLHGGRFFLAPNPAYRSVGHSLTTTHWQTQNSCHDEVSCRSMLLDEHISRLVSLEINSVRVVGMGVKYSTKTEDLGAPYFDAKIVWHSGDPLVGAPQNYRMDLTDPDHRLRYIELLREAIRLLGDHGIRTILHTAGGGAYKDASFENYLAWLRELSQALSTEPHLLAYDAMNEPEWFYDPALDDSSFSDACEYLSPDRSICKGTAQRVSKAWFDALTENDPRHFVTIGLADPYHSTRLWDPFILWDHFTSYHIYPEGPPDKRGWLDDSGFSASANFSNQIYMASLGGCGLPCPYLGEYDGANCFVGKGAAGQTGWYADGGFYYRPRTTGTPCPVGTQELHRCKVAEYDPSRDKPWATTAPTFYLRPSASFPSNHGCPPGVGFDGANCVIAHGPPGATGFVADDAFYYHHLIGTSNPCRPGDLDEGNRCKVADIPTASGSPFVLDKALFYVESISCGPQKPLHYGETGFATYRDGETADPCPYGANVTPDEIGCHLGTAPPGRLARHNAEENKFLYHRIGNESCLPSFTAAGSWCTRKSSMPNGFLLERPLYYVEPQNGQCPDPNTSPDSIGCLIATGPYGLDTSDGYFETRPFIRNGDFYYHQLDPEGVKCAAPSQEQGHRCWVAAVPSGYTPILPIPTQTRFYYPRCRNDGSDQQALDFLAGGATETWRGIFPQAHSCGFQGLHWWQFADVQHQMCRETSSLYAQPKIRSPGLELSDPNILLEKGHLPAFRAGVDFLSEPAESCQKPPLFHSSVDRRTFEGARYEFTGQVVDFDDQPIPNAVVYARAWHPNKGESYPFWTTTNAAGQYSVKMRYCLSQISASAFGYETSNSQTPLDYDPQDCTLGPGIHSAPTLRMLRLPKPKFGNQSTTIPKLLNPDLLNTPSTRQEACLVGEDWVVQ